MQSLLAQVNETPREYASAKQEAAAEAAGVPDLGDVTVATVDSFQAIFCRA